jgi:hypothetical protein
MAQKVPTPFASPFSKALLAVFWIAYAVMLLMLTVTYDPSLLVIAVAWTFILPWLTWCVLSGLQVEPGRRIGGGPMYPRVPLEPEEEILFNSPAFGPSTGAHLFVTNLRVIILPFRFFGSVEVIPVESITSVMPTSQGIGWPHPKESVDIAFEGGMRKIRPWAGPRFMGMIGGRDFVIGLTAALPATAK